jgi:hypothetical protein
MSKTLGRQRIAIPTVAQDKTITTAAKADPDAQPLTPSQLSAMLSMRTLRGRLAVANG